MARTIGSFVCGLIFGFGLLISGMVSPAKVLAFLDIFGAWDPSLVVVMAVALVVTYGGYAIARGQASPLIGDSHLWPANAGIDGKLMAGSAIFGLGWGLVGLCPGPALENIVTLSPKLLVFVAMMIAGMYVRDWQARREGSQPAIPRPVAADG